MGAGASVLDVGTEIRSASARDLADSLELLTPQERARLAAALQAVQQSLGSATVATQETGMQKSAAGMAVEIHVIVRKIDGEEVLTCAVNADKEITVLALKQMVAEKTAIAVHSQTILHGDSILDNLTSLLGVLTRSKQEDCIELTLQIRTFCFAGKYLVTLCNMDFRTAQYDQVCGHYVLEFHGDILQLKYSGYPDHVHTLKSWEELPGLKDLGERTVTWEDERTFTFYTQEFLGEIPVTFEEVDAAPLGMKFREHDLAVTQIADGRPAAKKGLQLGDLLRTINTANVAKAKLAEIGPLLRNRPLQLVFKRWACPGMNITTSTTWKHHDFELLSGLCNLHLRVHFQGDSPEDKVCLEVVDSEGTITSWWPLEIKYLGPLDE